MIKKIGVLTSGGDAPGMNAAIRAIVRAALHNGLEVYGIKDGYKGLVEGNIVKLNRRSVSDQLSRGGTFLGSARLEEFKEVETRQIAVDNLNKYGIEALVTIGGDGTYRGAKALTEMGINCIGLPGTIDNDIVCTDFTIGFMTALNTIVEAIDKLRDTSSSHHRCNIIEVMGRNCGDLASWSALACGAEIVITPENPYDLDNIMKELSRMKALGKRHAIVVVTEKVLDINHLKDLIQEKIGYETRTTVLGHIQRGGTPTVYDRVIASRMGLKAVELLMEGIKGVCIGIVDNELKYLEFGEALSLPKQKNNFTSIVPILE